MNPFSNRATFLSTSSYAVQEVACCAREDSSELAEQKRKRKKAVVVMEELQFSATRSGNTALSFEKLSESQSREAAGPL
jgi:hypothetical protein